MNITHVFIFSAEHHVLPYINFIKEQLSQDEFSTNVLVYSKVPSKEMRKLVSPNLVLTQERKNVVNHIKNANKNNKVIIHGIYDNVIFFKLLLTFKPLKFIYWVMWGGDVYFKAPTGLKGWLIKLSRKLVIPRIGFKLGFSCDYQWLFKKLDVKDKGEFRDVCFPAWFYTNINKNKGKLIRDKQSTNKLCALVGNSADPTNNFIALIDILKTTSLFGKYTFLLNYGGTPEYIEEVQSYAKQQLLHCDLSFLTSKLDYANYIEVVANHDAIIYNHDRQQGVGSLNVAFEHGLAVFIPKKNPLQENYNDWGVKVFTTQSLPKLSEVDIKNTLHKGVNRIKIQKHYHPNNVASNLLNILKENTDA